MGLHPPQVEKSHVGNFSGVEKSKIVNDSKTFAGIDPFQWLSSNHSFQMVMYEFVKKFVPGMEKIKTRGTKQALKESFSNARLELLNELKEVLKKRNEA